MDIRCNDLDSFGFLPSTCKVAARGRVFRGVNLVRSTGIWSVSSLSSGKWVLYSGIRCSLVLDWSARALDWAMTVVVPGFLRRRRLIRRWINTKSVSSSRPIPAERQAYKMQASLFSGTIAWLLQAFKSGSKGTSYSVFYRPKMHFYLILRRSTEVVLRISCLKREILKCIQSSIWCQICEELPWSDAFLGTRKT